MASLEHRGLWVLDHGSHRHRYECLVPYPLLATRQLLACSDLFPEDEGPAHCSALKERTVVGSRMGPVCVYEATLCAKQPSDALCSLRCTKSPEGH